MIWSAGPRLRHLALIVRSLDAAESAFRAVLGLAPSGRAVLAGERARVSFVPLPNSQVELLEPTDPQGPLSRFLATRGEGIHHLAFDVPDLESAMDRARKAGWRVIGDTPREGGRAPREGALGTRIAFVHPAGTHGVLIELVHRPAEQIGPELP